LTGSQALPVRKVTYDTATGLPTSTADLTTAGASAASITTGYDTWGRTVSYRDAATGAVPTTTAYDPAGRISSVTDAQGSSTYGYGVDANGATERRGLVTSLTVSGIGTFAGAYNSLGNLALQKLPGGFQQQTKYDSGGQATDLTYLGPDNTGNTVPWLGWHQGNDALGRVRHEDTPSGGAFTGALGTAKAHHRVYNYDPAGRLIMVRDRTNPTTGSLDATAAACETRTYEFDRDGNRKGSAINAATDTGACTTSNHISTTTSTFDKADRITDTGYTYDALGRTLTIPATPAGAAPPRLLRRRHGAHHQHRYNNPDVRAGPRRETPG
jgi:YD repeat-containing protein